MGSTTMQDQSKVQARIDLEEEAIFVDGVRQDIDDFESMAQFLIEQSSEGKIELEAQ